MPLTNLNYLSFFDSVLSTSAKVSVLIVFILLVKFALKNKISARVHYFLWFVIIVGLILPWTPQSSFSLYNLANVNVQPSTVMNEGTVTFPVFTLSNEPVADEVTTNSLEKAGVAQNESGGLTNPEGALNPNPGSLTSDTHSTASFLRDLLFFIWLLGIIVFITLTVVTNIKFARKIQGRSVVDPKFVSGFNEAKENLNVRKTISLIQTQAVKSPSLFGLFCPKLLIPVGVLDEFSPSQLNHVFVHELLHLKRMDILVNWFTRGLLFLHWFNPIIWYAFYKMRENQEQACDELALSHLGSNQVQEYGNTLIRLLESSYSKTHRIAGLACLSGSKSQIKRRITMLKMFKQTSLKWTIFGLLIIILLAFATLASAKDSNNAAQANSPLKTTAIEASLTPVAVNQSLVDEVKNSYGMGSPTYFPYSNETDIASIADGWFQSISSDSKVNLANARPTQPIFVKSYDQDIRDYYLVPFVSDGKFVATCSVITYVDATASVGEAVVYPLPQEKFFKLDANEAKTIISKTQNLTDVPQPTLAYIPGSSNRMEMPYWRFVLDENKIIYVNQEDGTILDSTVLSNPESENKAIEPSPVPDKDWSIAITKLVFKKGVDASNKLVNIYVTLSNNNGTDKPFLPTGRVVAYVGTSGKVYPTNEPFTLDEDYKNSQNFLKERAQKYGQNYQPGIYSFVPEILFDSAEESIAKVIYQDENENKIEIPVQEVTLEIAD